MSKNIREVANEQNEMKIKKAQVSKVKTFTVLHKTNDSLDVSIKVSKMRGIVDLYNSEELEIFVKHCDVVPMSFSTNSRFPSVTESVHNMWNQIIDDPLSFLENNLGIYVHCSDFTVEEKDGATWVNIKGASITNGGHTNTAILEAIKMGLLSEDKMGEVRMFIRKYKDFVDNKIKCATSIGLNSNEKQKGYGFSEQMGYHSAFKDALGSLVDCAEFKPNMIDDEDETVYFDPVDLVCMATIFTPLKSGLKNYRYTVGNSKSSVYNSYIGAIKRGETPDCHKLLPFMPEILGVTDHIMANMYKVANNKSISGEFKFVENHSLTPVTHKDCQYKLNRLLLYPILSALSENIVYDKKTGEISCQMDFIKLYDIVYKDLWSDMNDFWKKQKKDGMYTFCNSSSAEALWKLLHSKVEMAIMKYKFVSAT